MEIKDLRIGNFINNEFKKTICVSFDTLQSIHYRRNMFYTPIELTEEWLLKFGFEKVEYSDDQHGFGNEYNLKVNEDIFFNYSDDFSLCIYRSKESMENEIGIIPEWDAIKHVHQLQNLYYSLTGKEIVICN